MIILVSLGVAFPAVCILLKSTRKNNTVSYNNNTQCCSLVSMTLHGITILNLRAENGI
jgi:hypothetical protein